MGAGLSTSTMMFAEWMTATAAAAIVSEQVDRERLTPEEATASFLTLRPPDSYVVALVIRMLYEPEFDMGNADEKGSEKFLRRKVVFLQRKSDKSRFSRGTIQDTDLDVMLAEGFSPNRFLFYFPKVVTTGRPLIETMDGVMQFQFKFSTKEIALDFEPKKFVATIGDL